MNRFGKLAMEQLLYGKRRRTSTEFRPAGSAGYICACLYCDCRLYTENNICSRCRTPRHQKVVDIHG